MSEQVRDPSKAAKARQRGLTVLERLLAEETAAAEKEEARRLSRPRRALSVPRAQQGADKDANGGEGERGRGRQRINESGQRADGADVMQLQRRSRSLMSKKNWRRESHLVQRAARRGDWCATRAREGVLRGDEV